MQEGMRQDDVFGSADGNQMMICLFSAVFIIYRSGDSHV